MRKITLTLTMFLVCIVSLTSVAQDVDIYWGKFNTEDRFTSTVLIGRRAGFLFGIKRKMLKNRASILKYGMNDLQVTAEYPLIGKPAKGVTGKFISDDYIYNDALPMKDNFYMTVTKYDRKTKTNGLFIQEIDNTGRLTGNLKTLETIDAKSKYNRGAFDVIMSDDSTKFLLVDLPPYDKYAGEKLTFSIYDETLDQLKKLQVALPFTGKYFELDDITYANDGNIYMMAKIELEKKEKVKGESDFYYQLISINTQGDGAVTQYDVKLPGKYVDGISFDADDDKDIICAGLYGNMSGTAKGQLTGVFYMRLNKANQQVDASGIKELDKDFIADLTSERKANKGRGISNDFILRNFVKKTDGGSIILAEYSFDYTVTTTTKDGTHTDYHYVRNNIIAINVNPDGTIKWAADIPKYQHTVNDGGMFISYALATKDNKMYIIYNENPANMDPANIKSGKNARVMHNPYKSTAVLVTLSEDGQFDKKALFSNKDNKVVLMPKSDLKIGSHELIIPAYNGGVYCCFINFVAAKSKLARFDFK